MRFLAAALLTASALTAQCPFPGVAAHPAGVADIPDSCNVGLGGCSRAMMRLTLTGPAVARTIPRWRVEGLVNGPSNGAVVVISLASAPLAVPVFIVPGQLCAAFTPFRVYQLHLWPRFPVGGIAGEWDWWVPMPAAGFRVYSQAIVLDRGRVLMTQAVEVTGQ